MTDEAKRCVEALRDNINNGFLLVGGFNGSVHASEIIHLIESLSQTAEPVRRGEWAHLGGDEWCCTSCGNVIYTEGSWEKPTKKYCHECGAKMDGKVSE